MANRQDKRGRSKWPRGHCVVLPSSMVKSDAFRDLWGSSVRILLELMTRYFGNNNGDLSLSLDEAAAHLGMSKSTASAAFRDLQARGFLIKTSEGNFARGHAATWRLTFNASKHSGSTDEWKQWIKPARAPKARKPWGGTKAKAVELVRQAAAAKTFSGTENECIS
jgi:AraC-like DNA-binding protein